MAALVGGALTHKVDRRFGREALVKTQERSRSSALAATDRRRLEAVFLF